MPEDSRGNSFGSFSDLDDDILIKQDGSLKIFSHGNLSDFNASFKLEKQSTEVLDTGLEEKMLPPLVPAIFENKKADFYFDTDDRDEIIKHRQNLDKIKSTKKQYSLKKITEKIIQANAIELVPQLEAKFNNLVFSFLKHMRTNLDLEEVMNGRIINQGLGFEKDKTSKILNILSEIRSKIESSDGEILNDVNAQEFTNLSGLKTPSQKSENFSNLDPRQKIQIKSINSNIPFVNRVVETSASYRPRVSDVKQRAKITSPVEELGEITITVFRRLSSNPIESAQKIVENIISFGRESIIKKSMAVKSWRSSEVYKLYLTLGYESMEKNIPVSKLIEQKMIANEKTLTLDEFQAVSDINKKIRL